MIKGFRRIAVSAFAIIFLLFQISCGVADSPKAESEDSETVAGADTNARSNTDSETDTSTRLIPDPEDDGTPSHLTANGITEVAPNKNIIVFIIDRFDVKYCERVLNYDAGFFDALDGFTYFRDNTSHYTATYPAICYLTTGIEQDFSLTASEYFAKAYNTSEFLRDLHRNDFSIKLYTDSYHAYRDDTPFLKYFDNAVPSDAENKDLYIADDVELWQAVSNGLTVQSERRNGYIFYHLNGCHSPTSMDANCERTEDGSVRDACMGCFKIIYKYMDELKRLGLYENATVIITGDHSAGGTEDDAAPVNGTSLFVKPAGSQGKPLEYSDAQVSDVNLLPTLIKSAGVITDSQYGEGYFDIPEDRIGDRLLVRFMYGEGGSNDCTHYKITGPWRDKENWEVIFKINYPNLYK